MSDCDLTIMQKCITKHNELIKSLYDNFNDGITIDNINDVDNDKYTKYIEFVTNDDNINILKKIINNDHPLYKLLDSIEQFVTSYYNYEKTNFELSKYTILTVFDMTIDDMYNARRLDKLHDDNLREMINNLNNVYINVFYLI